MPGRNDRAFELIGFLQEAFVPHFCKVKVSPSRRLGKLDWTYQLLATNEMLAWAKFGEAICYFPRHSAERLWVKTRAQLAKGLSRLLNVPHLQRDITRNRFDTDTWSILTDVTGPKFWNLFDAVDIGPDRSKIWPWFRTQLLLAERFGKPRSSKMLLASLVSLDDDQWSSLLSRAYADLLGKNRTETRRLLNEILLKAATDVDLDIGASAPRGIELVAGFFLTMDQISLAGRHSTFQPAKDESVLPVLPRRSSWIRQSRLNLDSETIHDRFLALSKIAELCDENMHSVENDRLPTLGNSHAAFRRSLSDVIEKWQYGAGRGFTTDRAPDVPSLGGTKLTVLHSE